MSDCVRLADWPGKAPAPGSVADAGAPLLDAQQGHALPLPDRSIVPDGKPGAISPQTSRPGTSAADMDGHVSGSLVIEYRPGPARWADRGTFGGADD